MIGEACVASQCLLWALVVILFLLLIVQLRQRIALRDWLDAPEKQLPDGFGAWRDIFSRLQRLRKEEEKQRSAVRNALERFRLATQALPDGVILLDKGWYIEWLNTAACQHFLLDPARDIGTLIEQLIRQSEFLDFVAAFRQGTAQDTLLMQRGETTRSSACRSC